MKAAFTGVRRLAYWKLADNVVHGGATAMITSDPNVHRNPRV
jgi:hypothetical protein